MLEVKLEEIDSILEHAKQESNGSIVKAVKSIQKQLKDNEKLLIENYRQQVVMMATERITGEEASFDDAAGALCERFLNLDRS